MTAHHTLPAGVLAGFYCRACAAHHLADGAPRRPDDPAPDHRQETAA